MVERHAAPTDDWLRDAERVGRRLREALAASLSGVDAHLVMAPRPRAGWRPAHVPADCRAAAALIFLYPHDGEVRLALTLRAPSLIHHGGQVSLPGGAVEPGESIEQAALREAGEEIGLEPSQVDILGRLSPLHIPVSGYVLHPVVGLGRDRPSFRLDPREVARLLEVPLRVLADPAIVRLRWRTHEGRAYEVPYFLVDGEQVWGATAMVLGELLVALGAPPVLPLPGHETAQERS